MKKMGAGWFVLLWGIGGGSAFCFQMSDVSVTGSLSGLFERVADGTLEWTSIPLVSEEVFQGERDLYLLPDEEYEVEITAVAPDGGLLRLAMENTEGEEIASVEGPPEGTNLLTLRAVKPTLEFAIPIPGFPQGFHIGGKLMIGNFELSIALTGPAQLKTPPAPSTVTIKVMNIADQDKPVPYAWVWLYKQGRKNPPAFQTSLDGTVTFTVPPGKDYVLEYLGPPPSCHPRGQPIELLPGATHIFNVFLFHPHAGVRGRIRLVHVTPFEVVLRVYQGDNLLFTGGAIEGPPNGEGFYSYTLPPLGAGTYTLKAFVGKEVKDAKTLVIPDECTPYFARGNWEVVDSQGPHQVVQGPTLSVTMEEGSQEP